MQTEEEQRGVLLLHFETEKLIAFIVVWQEYLEDVIHIPSIR